MPVNSGLTLMLPTSGCTERQHQPFAEVVTIADIKDEVELLPSLQKPKKVCRPAAACCRRCCRCCCCCHLLSAAAVVERLLLC